MKDDSSAARITSRLVIAMAIALAGAFGGCDKSSTGGKDPSTGHGGAAETGTGGNAGTHGGPPGSGGSAGTAAGGWSGSTGGATSTGGTAGAGGATPSGAGGAGVGGAGGGPGTGAGGAKGAWSCLDVPPDLCFCNTSPPDPESTEACSTSFPCCVQTSATSCECADEETCQVILGTVEGARSVPNCPPP